MIGVSIMSVINWPEFSGLYWGHKALAGLNPAIFAAKHNFLFTFAVLPLK
ncbi:MAG: hypothetical protein WDO70_08690 [Alphaproteobacteria bacterium]